VLRSALLLGLGGVGQALAGCSTGDSPPPASTPPRTSRDSTPTGVTPVSGRILLAYFSRPGENYYYGGRRDLEVGNTQVLALMMAELVDCDVFRIEAADPYPDGYDATVARNVREQDADARPAIVNPMGAIDGYERVLLGSPIWNVRPPMIMNTFAASYDFSDKTVYPFVTHAVSGLGSTERVYRQACAGARISPGLAVQGEEVGQRREDVEAWLRQSRLLT
jgi:flavodoxin